jgi:hypothetical protein
VSNLKKYYDNIMTKKYDLVEKWNNGQGFGPLIWR